MTNPTSGLVACPACGHVQPHKERVCAACQRPFSANKRLSRAAVTLLPKPKAPPLVMGCGAYMIVAMIIALIANESAAGVIGLVAAVAVGALAYAGQDQELAMTAACPACAVPIETNPATPGQSMRCIPCGRHFLVTEQGFAGFAADTDSDLAVSGAILASTGFSGLGQNALCLLRFAEDAVVVMVHRAEAFEVVNTITYDQITYVRVGGRGAVTSGGGWVGGGFGLKGAVKGILIAEVLNALTTSTSVETFVNLNAGGRELMLHHTETTPEVLQVRLAPVFSRINSSSAPPSSSSAPPSSSPEAAPADRLAQLKVLGELRQSGVLTEDEFKAEKGRLLGPA